MRSCVRRLATLIALLCLSAATATAADSKYETELARWRTHEDVASWLRANFSFDRSRQAQALAQLRASGPQGALTRKPEVVFERPSGYCRDAAGFARDALNRINPDHQARYIFIRNRQGPPNHWVTGFNVNGKLHVIDYGAGPHWAAMQGLHGPYDTLEGYKDFLLSLSIRGFAPESVSWRDIPGRQD